MAYEKQNFLDGQIVTANHLNHIEDGIIAAQNTRNLLDNSDFTNPVNQRGKTSYDAIGYTIDRWVKEATSIVTIGSEGITIDNTSNNNDEVFIQKTDYKTAQTLIGKVVTVAVCKGDGTLYCGSSTVAYDTPVADIEAPDFHLTLHFFSSAESYQLARLAVPSGKSVTIKWIALYEGFYTADTLPPYVPKEYGVELTECKRYYNIIQYDMDDYYVNTNTEFPTIYPVSFPEMRIVPTVTLKENWNTGSAGVSVGYQTKSSLAFQAVATSSRIAWHGKIELNADL